MKRLKLRKRYDFLKILPKNARCIELGVFKGNFSRAILRLTNPEFLCSVDPYWKLYGDKFPWSSSCTNNGTLTTIEAYDMAYSKLKPWINSNKCSLIIENDENWLPTIGYRTIDWVYIDSSHLYDHTLYELNMCKRIIKNNGIICGHDWNPHPKAKHPEVYLAVNDFLKENSIFKLDYIDNHGQWAISIDGNYNQ